MDPVTLAHKSRVAQSREADLFLWYTRRSQAGVIACYNTKRIPITAATLLRWIDMVARGYASMAVQQIQPERVHFHTWVISPPDHFDGSTISGTLGPGDYGCFEAARVEEGSESPEPSSEVDYPDPIHFTPTLKFFERSIFFQYLQQGIPEKDVSPLSPITLELLQEVTTPHNECIFTAASYPTTATVEISWILPPHLKRKSLQFTRGEKHNYDSDDLPWDSSSNLAPIRSDVYQMWLENAFSVDVDDGYRIYIHVKYIKDLGMVDDLGLPERLDATKVQDSWLPFLREHHRHTVAARILGGDVHTPEDPVGKELKKYFVDPLEPITRYNLDDELWKTWIGEDIKEWMFTRCWDRNSTKQVL